ncbi:MAG: hypothetical protein K2H22_07460, partial [Muribaculaceae bacterium]|nr:hypothetical protein [Muribaculaceae bacterium]
LGAVCIALCGMGASPKQLLSSASAQTFDRSVDIRPFGNLRMPGQKSSVKKAPAKVGSPEDIITSVEGVTQDMCYTADGYYIYQIYHMPYENQIGPSHVVYGENDEVYFYDIIPNAMTDAYVKGVRKGDKIEVSLPQTVKWYDGYGYGLNVSLLKKEVTVDKTGEETFWYYATDDPCVTFTVAEDGSMVAEELSEDLMLGLVFSDDGEWYYYGVTSLSLAPFDEKPVEAPADIEVSENFWVYNAGDYGWPVSWAQGYDEFYFKGLCPEMPEAWVMGSVEYGDDSAVVSIAQDQYVGIIAGAFIYTKFAKLVFDEEGVLVDAEIMPDDYKYELVWDYEDNVMTAKDPEVSFVFNAAKSYIYYLDYLTDIRLEHQDGFAGTPVDPVNLVFEDEYEEYGRGMFLFNVPAVSTEGDLLDTESLCYVIYVDGEEWEFDADEFLLSESIVEIPWSMSEYYIYNWGGSRREIDFPVEGITTLGVQSIYRYDGEETRSGIVTINVDDPSSVAALATDSKVVDVRYYDLSGRQVAAPAAGICVKRVTFEDGTVASFKKVVR